MPLLRLTQHIIENQPDHYRVEIAYEDSDGSRLTADPNFEFKLDPQDRSDMRWYLEDYLQYPMTPAPEIAVRIEARMADLGKELFHLVFEVDKDALEMLPDLRKHLDDTRVEVVTDVQGATALPWELLRDPRTDAAMAVRAKAFVRGYSKPVQKAYLPKTQEKIRILLVICRPGGREDVPFRSVAGKIVKGMGEEARQAFDLEVLRPPTFAQLSKVLREAKAQGKPYHILHFDGHGGYVDLAKVKGAEVLHGLMPVLLGAPRSGEHGYLLFENPAKDDNIEWVDGPSLGKLLVETDTPVLVLNACRSAHAEPDLTPMLGASPGPPPPERGSPTGRGESDDTHSQVRAFGSLAQEVMDAGVAGVVAMRYNVYVVTAAQFVADLYAALASGQTLGEAVSMGRKQLAAQPLREIAFEPRPLQDWSVPVVYEAAPIQLLKPVGAIHESPRLQINLSKIEKADDGLPRPEIGFYGRDETILALDRAFDSQQVVILHAYAGSGKTMTAAEFARWYRDTGGLDVGAQPAAPILFTTFEQYKPLSRVLDAVEQTFRSLLEQNNSQWLAMSDDDRLDLSLQIFKQNPVLWIWDNVEPINGFPTGTPSVWTEKEQRDLKTFLQIVAGQSKAKFLLTSRRDERAWLGDLPRRVTLPPMPMQEMVQLARALAEKQGKRMSAVKNWQPLLKFTQGNPMTLTVIVGQAFRDGIETEAQIKAYLEKLRNGEAAFSDEASEGRTKSLGASLAYGFEQAFNDEERKVLALLHFFQGFVQVPTLLLMGNPKADYSLPELEHLTRDTGIGLLDKAADLGLLTAHGGGCYTIHPALPWFFKGLFEQYYPTVDDGRLTVENRPPSTVNGPPSALHATRAFAESLGELGNYYHDQYEDGNRDVIALLRREEPNLLHARQLARQHGWWDALTSTMQGLDHLYDHTGRHSEWKHLVDEIVPDLVTADDLPLPGREKQWRIVTQYCIALAQESRDWAEAERLQRKCVDEDHRNAAHMLTRPPESLDAVEKNALRMLALSLNQLAKIIRDQKHLEFTDPFEQADKIFAIISDNTARAHNAMNFGNAFLRNPITRNLVQAEKWCLMAKELYESDDVKSQAGALGQLGAVALSRFNVAKKEGKAKDELNRHLDTAADYYQQALALLPPDAVDDLAVAHNQLGLIYRNAGDLERILVHYNESIRYKEMAGDQYGAGITRFNFAIALADNGRLPDALLYARAALRNFESYGQGAAEMIEKTQMLITEIEQAMKGKDSGR